MNLLSVPIDLHCLDISYKWNLMLRGLLHLACLTHYVFEVRPCWTVSQYLTPCCAGRYSIAWIDHILFICFIDWWTFGLFPLVGYCEYCYSEHSRTGLCGRVFTSLRYVPRGRIAGSHGNSMFNLLNCWRTEIVFLKQAFYPSKHLSIRMQNSQLYKPPQIFTKGIHPHNQYPDQGTECD